MSVCRKNTYPLPAYRLKSNLVFLLNNRELVQVKGKFIVLVGKTEFQFFNKNHCFAFRNEIRVTTRPSIHDDTGDHGGVYHESKSISSHCSDDK